MDKLSGLASKLGGGSKGNQSSGNEDYVDKGLDTAEGKLSGGKVDPAKMRSTNEKITDTGREQFEKATGKNVPDKVSN
ncbi:uncharacterized protein N7498_006859 [Penicillium cinerascens]|uniref:Antitoxin n=1 Tax=Penicillium cinerascens TaxID=70096 RepID=A0A9W9JKR0_9EURO|nr:uncharacterized protein N7498_006859 [Penicillium cinerascens]KAJ5197742.1 hypothetical protein N7498_006859 [Penicillium cinerascens]